MSISRENRISHSRLQCASDLDISNMRLSRLESKVKRVFFSCKTYLFYNRTCRFFRYDRFSSRNRLKEIIGFVSIESNESFIVVF